MNFSYLPVLIFPMLLCFISSAAGATSDTLNNGGNITDGETLVSSGGSFTLGFFSPTGVPAKRYLGIWFTASPDAVCWVANRDSPLSNDTSGVLVIRSPGIILRLLDGSGHAAWSSNTTSSAPDAVAQLLDSGNLVVREQQRSGGNVLWQSFGDPSNTLVAGMTLGAERSLTSWRAPNDPTSGDCRHVMDDGGGVPGSEMTSYSDSQNEVAYIFNNTADAPFSRLVLNEVCVLQRLAWDPASRVWNTSVQAPRDVCDDYAICGAFGLCNVNMASTLVCSCLFGFNPVNQSQWSMREFSGGCRRNVPLQCSNGTTTDGFMVLRGVNLPDTDNTTVDMSATLEQCRARCSSSCWCVAYALADIRGGGGGSGCITWINDIVDIRYVDKGQDLYVRLAKSEFRAQRERRNVAKIVISVTAASLLAVTVTAVTYLVWKRKFRGLRRKSGGQSASNKDLGDEALELPFVSFREIVSATNNFSEDYMLGRGGFGKVYKGTMLVDNKQVAIKRLDEKLLIYEYLQNKSLDSFIFDASSKRLLDWATRFKIIKGISRGLLYLHQDSRLTIIHRDLKSSNILLDSDMSPKISDFSMARLFGENQQEANTSRVVGTYGYMSPEYAMDGTFSVKSDTYSFGVILLEIISGLKINSTQFTSFPSLLAYAWSLWNDDNAIDLVDSSLVESCSSTEALQCIHIGLLCVQDNPNSRPFMSSVVSLLENGTTPLSVPKQPLYFSQWYLEAQGTGENANKSTNKMSVTVLEGR
ncbi:unnamed protein product [Urochloa decumbens]|uniref:Receptor-like serine/threonine-protein kinase n=1 Tax=Urochloa decumbens TaxID=240449 RepID=A0ABC9C7A7_9POAL